LVDEDRRIRFATLAFTGHKVNELQTCVLNGQLTAAQVQAVAEYKNAMAVLTSNEGAWHEDLYCSEFSFCGV
jgi:hypothetical protein